jgi:hypothetical protein
MKTFKEFQEQIEQEIAQNKLDAQKSMNVTKTNARASMKQRTHVAAELARRENSQT